MRTQSTVSGSDLQHDASLTIGPVSLLYCGGDVRYLSIGPHEIIRRMYVAVRDTEWGTVEPVLQNLRYTSKSDGFRIEYDAEHRRDGIHFDWHATITARYAQSSGDESVTLRFEMEGMARSRFETSRTGFCVLHPLRECAGASCEVEHPSGSSTRGAFPRQVKPHQVFFDVQAMRYEPAAGIQAEVRFEGEVFETEDQRNWTDGSYKTYCRPLSLPFPYTLEPGQPVRQAVVVKVSIKGGAPLTTAAEPTDELRIGAAVGPLPAIGLSIRQDGPRLEERQIELLRALKLSHLRADIRMARSGWGDALKEAVRQANDVGASLELAVHLSAAEGGEEQRLRELDQRLQAHDRVARCLVFRDRKPSTDIADVGLCRRHLGGLASVPIGGGTIGNFAEVNGARPPAGAFDVIAYPISPQIHSTDDLSLIENLQGIPDTVLTARSFASGARIAVGPVIFHQRPDSFAEGNSGTESDTSPGDPRQQTPFGAGWTLGCLQALSESGADSVTLYETTGPRGVIDDRSAQVFPLYPVLADIGEFVGGRVIQSTCEGSLGVVSLVLQKGRRIRVLLATFDPAGRDIKLTAVPSDWRITKPAPDGGGPLQVKVHPDSILRLDFEQEGA